MFLKDSKAIDVIRNKRHMSCIKSLCFILREMENCWGVFREVDELDNIFERSHWQYQKNNKLELNKAS